MSSRRVGQGRVYVQLGPQTQIDFPEWCQALAAGRSYVSDGYAHALEFDVEGHQPGGEGVELEQARRVKVSTTVAFAPIQPRAVAYGTLEAAAGRRMSGDTVNLHAPRDTGVVEGGSRLVELIANGQVVASQPVVADGQPHRLDFDVDVGQSCWIAVRQFPQLHTNPVNVILADQPIRASRSSAVWCYESVRRLWRNRARFISAAERPPAKLAYEQALQTYLRIASECQPDGTPLPSAEDMRTLP